MTPEASARFREFPIYNLADGEPRYLVGSYEDQRLRFVRTQHDEVDAIEAFGTFLWDIRFKNWVAEYFLGTLSREEFEHSIGE